MMSLSSSQAGIVAARRNKLNQTQFSSYRYVKVEWDREIDFVNGPPGIKASFTARHIYRYDKPNNSFYPLGVQKAQSLKRTITWVNQIIIAGFTDTNINGTYTRTAPNQNFYKNANYYITNANFFNNEYGTLFANSNEIAGVYYYPENSILSVYDTDFTPYNGTQPTINIVSDDTWIDNTSLKNINNNRLYTNINPDLTREQLDPNVNFNINTANVFDKKNLAHNQKVFLDVRWVKFVDTERINDEEWWQNNIGFITMNDRKGHIYRAGIIIKDNIIDSMLYHTDLATNPVLTYKMRAYNCFYRLGI
jgi:hypothetical protein